MDYDVVIVGAGPVGLALAAQLGQAGHRVGVFERCGGLFGLPRAIRFDGEAMRLFQQLGIVPEIEHDIVAAPNYVWYGADGDVLVDIDMSMPTPSGWAISYCFWQPTLEAAMERAVLRCETVELQRNWAAEAVEQSAEGVTVTLRHGSEPERGRFVGDETTRTVTARYLVGADGANSAVREAGGIGREDFGFKERWLVVDVKPNDMSIFADRPVAAQHCDPRRPSVMVQNGSEHYRWEFMLLPGEGLESFSDVATVWPLLSEYLYPDDGTIVRHAIYEFSSTLAESMRDGRVLLVGDSAHTMPPFMGEGMCSGLRDAANLAWRLGLILNGSAAPALLDDYSSERRPHTRALIEISIGMGQVSCVTDPQAAAVRDAAFRAGQVPPPPPMPGLAQGTLQGPERPGDVAGTLAVQGSVRTPDGRAGRFDDVVGTGFSLVLLQQDPQALLSDEQQAFLAQLGAHTVTFDASVEGALGDEDGQLTGWMQERGIVAVLARPDGYAFGAAATPEDVPALVDELRSSLTRQALTA